MFKRLSRLAKTIIDLPDIIDLILTELDEIRVAKTNDPLVTGTIIHQYDVCNHEYPNSWSGTIPPSCLKCGKPAEYWVTYN